MAEFTVWAFVLNLCYLAVTIGVALWLPAFLDRKLEIGFKEDVWQKMGGSPMALAVYHGLRFVGICLLASAFVR